MPVLLRQSELKDSCNGRQWKVLVSDDISNSDHVHVYGFSHPTHLTFHLPYSLSQPYDGKFSGFPMFTARSVLISIRGLDNTGSPDSWHHMLQKCYFGVTTHPEWKSLRKCRMRAIGGKILGVNMKYFLPEALFLPGFKKGLGKWESKGRVALKRFLAKRGRFCWRS